MNFRDFALLADENISPELVAFLRTEGFDVQDVKEEGLIGHSMKSFSTVLSDRIESC